MIDSKGLYGSFWILLMGSCPSEMLSLSSVWNQTAILNFLLYYLTCVRIESKTAVYETTEKA